MILVHSFSEITLTAKGLKIAIVNIYFPAQEIHFQKDHPQSLATAIINNDRKIPI